jgi:hypothetical protein
VAACSWRRRRRAKTRCSSRVFKAPAPAEVRSASIFDTAANMRFGAVARNSPIPSRYVGSHDSLRCERRPTLLPLTSLLAS